MEISYSVETTNNELICNPRQAFLGHPAKFLTSSQNKSIALFISTTSVPLPQAMLKQSRSKNVSLFKWRFKSILC